MGCYHPKIRIENKHLFVTAIDGHKYHKATIEQPDDIVSRLEELRHHPDYSYSVIPCRNCIGCRLDYSREWANRGYLESKTTTNNYFVTLTYDDENIVILDEITTSNGITYTNDETWNGNLIPKDFSKFIHDIRQYFERKYGHTGIKYMGCGEYGEERQRPHYHIIFFNLPLPTESFYESKIINNEFYWRNHIIEKYWKKGISNICPATWNNIAYTARYITKKINGTGSEEEYAEKGQIKEFFRMSRGIGRNYYELFKNDIYKIDEITIHNKNGTIKAKPPKYYDKLYEKENPRRMEEIKKKRKHQINNQDKIKDEQTSLTRLQQLAVKERTHEDKHKQLIRQFEKNQR